MICLITLAIPCHAAPLTPDSLHGADTIVLSTSAHTHCYCVTVQGLELDMALLSPICEAAKLGLHKDFEESHTSKDLIVPPTVSACVLTSTTTLRVCRDYRADAVHCLSGKLKANALLPHFLTDGSMHCCLTVNTGIRKILPQVARLLFCKKKQSVPSDPCCRMAVLRCPGELCAQSDCSKKLQLL